MHKHTIDWLRQVHITGSPADTSLAERRWTMAEKWTEDLTRARVIELLRLFLYSKTDPVAVQRVTDELLDLDKEFPVSENTEEVRLVAGLAMAARFEEPTNYSDAFALGLASAEFPVGRTHPVQPGIVTVSREYLLTEARRMRPGDSVDSASEIVKTLNTRSKALEEAEKTEDDAKIQQALASYRKSVASTIGDSYTALSNRVSQLSEESDLLWWVLSEYSSGLEKSFNDLHVASYAIVAASEAADRTSILPPPTAIFSLLSRVLRTCKPSKKKLTVMDFLQGVPGDWRAKFVKSVVGDCTDLTPLTTALVKTEELGISAAMSFTEKYFGINGNSELAPAEVAHQVYKELVFLQALDLLPRE